MGCKMKLLCIALLLLAGILSAASAWGEDYDLIDDMTWHQSASGETLFVRPCDSCPDSLIRSAAAEGRICKLYGHWWSDPEFDWYGDREFHTCRLCGKEQTWQPGVWR